MRLFLRGEDIVCSLNEFSRIKQFVGQQLLLGELQILSCGGCTCLYWRLKVKGSQSQSIVLTPWRQPLSTVYIKSVWHHPFKMQTCWAAGIQPYAFLVYKRQWNTITLDSWAPLFTNKHVSDGPLYFLFFVFSFNITYLNNTEKLL